VDAPATTPAQPVAKNQPKESPIEKGIRLYKELELDAAALGLFADEIPENVTIDQIRSMYKELRQFVDDAKAQASS